MVYVTKTNPESSNTVLIHSAKGTTWKNHKYVRKENGHYIYPKKSSTQTNKKRGKERIQQTPQSYGKISSSKASKMAYQSSSSRKQLDYALNEVNSVFKNIKDSAMKKKTSVTVLRNIINELVPKMFSGSKKSSGTIETSKKSTGTGEVVSSRNTSTGSVEPSKKKKKSNASY